MMFYPIAGLLVLTALTAVFARSIVYSILSLAFFFTALSGAYALLGSEFLAIGQLLIFVGGIVVMLLMALNISKSQLKLVSKPTLFRLFLVLVLFLLLLYTVLGNYQEASFTELSLKMIASLFVTQYLALMILFGIFLLTAVAVALYFLRREA